MEHPLWFFSEFSGSLESPLFYRLGNKKQLEGWEGRVLYSLCCLHFSTQAMLKNSQRMEGHFNMMFIEVRLHLNVFNIWSIFSFLFIGRAVTTRTLNNCLQKSVLLQIINILLMCNLWQRVIWHILVDQKNGDRMIKQLLLNSVTPNYHDILLNLVQWLLIISGHMLYLTTTWCLLPILQCWIPWVWKGNSSWCKHFKIYLYIILYLF